MEKEDIIANFEETNNIEFQKEPVEEKPKEIVTREDNTPTAKKIIEDTKVDVLKAISTDESFRNATKELAERDVNAKLREDALKVLDAEQKNQLAEYTLRKEKERLDYIAAHERSIEREEIKAKLYQRKRKSAEDRYGYLYKQEIVTMLDENGNEIQQVRYKNFTISKTINRLREFSNWYKNLADTTRKIIGTTLKVLLICGIIAAAGFTLYGLIKWLIHSGILNVALGN